MRFAILSDIHANLEALQKALEIIETKNVDSIICLGDSVGYGASPNETIELLCQRTSHILLGNHDEAAIDTGYADGFNTYARSAAHWTANELTDEHKEFLTKLPFEYRQDNVLFVHSSPFEPSDWHYVLSTADALHNFSYFDEAICFVGHSHVPGVFAEDIWTRKVCRGKRFIVNVGSVGQPRDNDPRLSFGLFDTTSWEYENIRAEYDVKTAADKIRRSGLPRMLADRILEGR